MRYNWPSVLGPGSVQFLFVFFSSDLRQSWKNWNIEQLNIYGFISMSSFVVQQARKLQATLEDANQKLWLTYLLTDGGEV